MQANSTKEQKAEEFQFLRCSPQIQNINPVELYGAHTVEILIKPCREFKMPLEKT